MFTRVGGSSVGGLPDNPPGHGNIQVAGQTFTPQQYAPPAQPQTQAPQPTYFNPNWNQSQAAAPPPVDQAPVQNPTLSQPAAPVATGANPSTSAVGVGNMGGGLKSQQSNAQIWQGAPQYTSQLYANMYSGNPGGIPSSIPNGQLTAGNPAVGITSSNMPSYLQNNLSGTPTPDTNTLNIGQNQSYLAGLNLKPQQMSYLRGAGG